MFFLIAKTHF